jgi:diguanylate cyclase (GGDEF)-like protein
LTVNGSATAPVDKSRCAQEPIHIPGSIQPHGVLFVLSDPELVVLQVSANIETLLGFPVAGVLGTHVATVLGAGETERLERLLHEESRALASPPRFVLGRGPLLAEFECVLHRSGNVVIVELERYEPSSSPNPFDAFAHVRTPIEQMERAPDIATLVRNAADAMRLISGFDRALIYRFDEDWHGDVIAESTNGGLPVAYLGLRFPASDIPEQARRLYLANPLRVVADAGYVPAPLVPEREPRTGQPVDLSRAVLRSVSPVHLEYLRNMGVSGSLTVSLIVEGRLWGLIACHHRQPRRVDYVTRASCEFFGRMLSWQLGSRLMNEDAQRKLSAYTLIGTYTRTLASIEELGEGLMADAQVLLELFAAQGLAFSVDGTLRRLGAVPDDASVGSIAAGLQYGAEDGVAASSQLATIVPEVALRDQGACGALLIRLSERGDEYLLCFREEVVKSIDWGGDMRVPVTEVAGKLHPRTSFRLWQETVRGQSARWSAQDHDSARRLRERIIERSQMLKHRRAEERLRHAANHDPLTQLPNRAGIDETLARLLIEAQRDDSILALVFVDLDHFKSYNDTLGHLAGDRVLQTAAVRMRSCVRHGDIVGRLGGDEFVVILPELAKPDDADFVAGKILAAIAEPLSVEGHEIRCTASVGVAVYPSDSSDAAGLVRNADIAMYRAKERGRNCFARFEDGAGPAAG